MSVRRRILVVDDDDTIRELVAMALEDAGFETLAAGHGADALATLCNAHVDLILLDMRMPIMDGWEFAQAYWARPGPHAPIIVLTAGHSAAQAAAGIAAVGYLSKPFELDALLGAVDRALDGHGPQHLATPGG